MRHVHTITGWLACTIRPCAYRRMDHSRKISELAREADRLGTERKATLKRMVDEERERLYEIIDAGEIDSADDALLVNFARNGGTRHGRIRRVDTTPTEEKSRAAFPLDRAARGEALFGDPRLTAALKPSATDTDWRI